MHSGLLVPAATKEKGLHGLPRMQQTEFTDERGRPVIRRQWRNTDGELHRTTGPAMEEWAVLPGGAHLLSYQIWYVNGKRHREDRPAWRIWHIADDGTRVLKCEEWWQHGLWHRMNGPTCRYWTMEPDDTRILQCVWWYVNGRLHRVDGPAYEGHGFYWHCKRVKREDLPWLRRGRSFLLALAGFTGATPTLCSAGDGGAGGRGVSPEWCRDARVTTVTWHGGGAGDAVVAGYRSAVGGSGLLCV